MRRAEKRRVAFTLIELLVVMAIISILMGLLVPAVQKVRIAASRTQCQNNFKQVALAMSAYENVSKIFPATYYFNYPNTGYTWIGSLVHILPYIEQGSLNMDLSKNWWQNASSSYGTPISIFQCPSNPDGNLRLDDKTYAAPYVTSPADFNSYTIYTYPGMFGTTYPLYTELPGVFHYLNPTRMRQILDGTSNTIMYAESAGAPTFYQGSKPTTSSYFYSRGWAIGTSNSYLYTSSMDGLVWNGPCAMNCQNQWQPYSFHPGGINAAFVDGSVRFLTQSLQPAMLAALITRAAEDQVPNLD